MLKKNDIRTNFLLRGNAIEEKNEDINYKKYLFNSKFNDNINFGLLKKTSSKKKTAINNSDLPYNREKTNAQNKRIRDKMSTNSQNDLDIAFEGGNNLISRNFFNSKDPRETIYKNSPLISNSYNILNNNLFKKIASINKKDHIKDLLNYGNREQLYDFIGKRGFSQSIMHNRNVKIKENISKDELSEYYINNSWSVPEYAYKEEPNSKYREYMEDKGKSIDGFNNDNNIGIFCIFDGHGGREVSMYLQKNIVNYLKEYIIDSDNIEHYLVNVFKIIDEKLDDEYYNLIGSTACVVYITKENSKKCFYCANVGDTRCVLIRSNGAKRISYDDRATDVLESNRVKSEGGIIFGGRIYGQLMLTRAFGDSGLKKYGVICTPHIKRVEIDFEDKYIIIASDGVWDVIDENEVYEYSLISHNSKELCDIIVKNSINKGSTDNISCFVIKLN